MCIIQDYIAREVWLPAFLRKVYYTIVIHGSHYNQAVEEDLDQFAMAAWKCSIKQLDSSERALKLDRELDSMYFSVNWIWNEH